MVEAKHPMVPVAGDQENAVMTLLAQNKIPGGTAGISPSISAVALKAAIALLKGYKVPTNCIVATPRAYDNADLKPGVNYFPELPPNFTCTISFPDADINFTPDEIMKQTAENQ
jgi:ribose transport system substrate-binding protein